MYTNVYTNLLQYIFERYSMKKMKKIHPAVAATDFVVRSMYHTTLQATPGQLVFYCDMILNTPLIAYW